MHSIEYTLDVHEICLGCSMLAQHQQRKLCFRLNAYFCTSIALVYTDLVFVSRDCRAMRRGGDQQWLFCGFLHYIKQNDKLQFVRCSYFGAINSIFQISVARKQFCIMNADGNYIAWCMYDVEAFMLYAYTREAASWRMLHASMPRSTEKERECVCVGTSALKIDMQSSILNSIWPMMCCASNWIFDGRWIHDGNVKFK